MFRCLVPIILLLLTLSTRARSERRAADVYDSELKNFVDQFIAEQMSHRNVPGAAFCWVEAGSVRVLSGYGIADANTSVPVDPNSTIFQVGSISKPVTAMGALKLAHDYHLDRNEDLSRFLPVLPASARTAPITLHQLLTHTSGFDPVFVDIGAADPSEMLDLKDYVRLRTPPRTVAPGQFVLYNNFGFTLAGRIIEQISGLSFADYMQRNVLDPLGMRASSFAPRKYETLAHGHDYVNGRYVPVRSLYLNDTPASGLTTTAADMGKFLLAALGGANGVLCDDDLQLMHRCQFAHHPQLEGLTYGFSERTLHGERLLEHGGIWNGFTCKLCLLPRHNAGFFVVYNRYDPKLLDEITRPLIEHRYPRAPEAESKTDDSIKRSFAELVGEYRNTYYAHGTMEKLRVLWKAPARVYLDEHGEVMVQEPGEQARRVYPAGDLLFASRGEAPSVAFRRDSSGAITHLFVGTTAYERQHWWDLARAHLVAIGLYAFCFVLCVPVMVGRWGWALCHHRRVTAAGAVLRGGIALCAACNAVFMVALARLLVNYEMRDIVYGLPTWLTRLFGLPMLAAVGAICAALLTVRSIYHHESRMRIARHTLFAILALAFIPLLAYWNLFIPRY